MFIDFVGAFSNLPRKFALDILKEKGALDEDGLMILKFLYQNTVVQFGSKKVKLTKGAPMGFLSSPAVFGIALEKLLEMLDKEGIICLLYCDDLVVVGTRSDILLAQKILNEFSFLSKFEVSGPKSGIVKLARLSKKKDGHPLWKEYFEWKPLPWLESYKYLGTLVTRADNLD